MYCNLGTWELGNLGTWELGHASSALWLYLCPTPTSDLPTSKYSSTSPTKGPGIDGDGFARSGIGQHPTRVKSLAAEAIIFGPLPLLADDGPAVEFLD